MPYSLPPWLDVTPSYFTSALEAGARTGIAVADQQQRAQQVAEARAERQAQLQQRADEEAERSRQFEQTRLLNVQKVAQDAQQLQQQVAHQTALEKNQQAQESRLLDYQKGVLGVDQARQKLAEKVTATPTVWVPGEVGVEGGAPGHFENVTHTGVRVTVPPAAKVDKDLLPKETALSDGTKIVYNPNTGAFKLLPVKGEEKPITGPQLLAIANALPTRDPNAKSIMTFLSGKATNQISNAAATVTPKPVANATRIRRKSDKSEFLYRGNPADIPRDQYDVLP